MSKVRLYLSEQTGFYNYFGRGDYRNGRRFEDLDLTPDQQDAFIEYVAPQKKESDVWWPGESQEETLMMVRGEVPHPECDGCNDGSPVIKLLNNLEIVLNDRITHPSCLGRKLWSPDFLTDLIPPSHIHHRSGSLRSTDRSPIPRTHQQEWIQRLPASASDLRGWLIVGPAGSSKTTYVAAALVDMLTTRLVGYGLQKADLNYYRLKVPQWLSSMEAWETRDFGDKAVAPPKLTPSVIEDETDRTGVPPILWLEELDKFNPTQPRLRNLYTLVDAVYEASGTIISTANDKLPELRKRLTDPIYRRLSGIYDPPGQYLVFDMWTGPKNS